jgi:hypothetical protein
MNAGSFGLLVQTRPADTVAGAIPHPPRHAEDHLFHRTRQRCRAGARSALAEINAAFLAVVRTIYRK